MEQAYVYKWTHIPTLKWYVGSRTAKNCHPDDGYICSSRTVKPLIKANPNEWTRDIIDVGSAQAMKELEAEILQLFDAASDPRSFNKNNAKSNAGWNKGLKGSQVPWNKGLKGSQVAWNKGLAKEQQPNYGKKHPGKPWTRSEKGETMLEDLKDRNKVRNAEQATCPHCGKTGQKIAMSRFHFDRCAFTQKGGV